MYLRLHYGNVREQTLCTHVRKVLFFSDKCAYIEGKVLWGHRNSSWPQLPVK